MEIAMINEHEFQQDLEATALPALDSCMHDGYMDPAVSDWHGHRLRTLHPADGTPNKLHVVRYDVEKFHALQIPGSSRQTHGTVLISHGFTEFAAKYKEMAWYFLLAGFSVCILEHRGHGYSARDVRNDQIVYIDTWHRYVADLAKCARTIARPMAADKPLVLFAHSMGGGIAAAMLERYPNIVDKAVLSSPMIEANLHTPNWLAALVCGAACDFGHAKSMAPGQRAFTPLIDIKDNQGACMQRLEWMKKLRIADTHYQTSAAANEWVRQAIRLSIAMQDPHMCERIETPILLFQAGNDHWVRNKAQNRFVKRVGKDGGDIRMVRVPGSVHEIFTMPNSVMAPYLKEILTFLQTSEAVTVLV